MAVVLEDRYKGLRAPHKTLGVSPGVQGFRGSGFRGFGFLGLGFRGLGLRV